jgi:hypothetical protein
MKTNCLVLLLLLTGCGSMFQESDVALIREPGHRTYNDPPEKVVVSAQFLWQPAVLSDNVYLDTSIAELAKAEEGKACSLNRTDRLELRGWERWPDVPSTELRQEAEKTDLQLEIWEKQGSPLIVAVVFRGTEAQRLRDWASNFRWFLRFIPGFRDQYVLVSEKIGAAVLNKIKAELERGNTKYDDVQIIAAGHSLGGGLAQHLAYSLPDIKGAERATDVSRVQCLRFRSVSGDRMVFDSARASRYECAWVAHRSRLRTRRNSFIHPVDPQVSKSASSKRSQHPRDPL